MPNFPVKKGVYTNQAHVNVPEGTYELEHGREGFASQEVSHLYVKEAPSHWSRVEGDLRPRAIDCNAIVPSDATEADGTPLELMQAAAWCGKKTLSMFLSKRTESMPYIHRSVDGDEMYFVHQGHGRIETEYGVLEYERGDYIIIPRGSLYRVIPETTDTFMLITESRTPFMIPERGILGPHALFDKGVLRQPDWDTPREHWRQDEYEVRIKRQGRYSKAFFDYNPLTNVQGWKGTLTPFILNVRDFRPLSSLRYHVTPTTGATFESEEVFVGTFAPRALGDENTLRLPFYHRNIDYDEFIFYHDGEFFSRGGIKEGMITLHPAGLDHGPHPVAWERDRAAIEKAKQNPGIKATYTSETAVALDTTHQLFCTQEALEAELPDYATSWYDQAKTLVNE